jgi:hypothetical protein
MRLYVCCVCVVFLNNSKKGSTHQSLSLSGAQAGFVDVEEEQLTLHFFEFFSKTSDTTPTKHQQRLQDLK